MSTSTKSILCCLRIILLVLLLCSGGLFVAAAAIGRKGIEDSAGMENREDDSNDP